MNPRTRLYSIILTIMSMFLLWLTLPALPVAAGDPFTGLIEWTPNSPDNASVTVVAGNSAGIDTQNPGINVAEAPSCPTGTIAYWKLDETSGTTYSDSYDGHDGACAGDCPTPATGQINGGQVFSTTIFSTTTGIDVPADPAFDWGQNDSFSIELWMKGVPGQTCPAGSSDVMVGRDDSSTDLQWWLGCRYGKAKLKIGDKSGNYNILENAGPTITDGAWHHVVGLRDGINNLNRLYVDGAEVISATQTYSDSFASTSAINLGWINNGDGFQFEGGTLDEVALYSKALSATEVQQHYNKGRDKTGLCEAPSITIAKTPDTQTVTSGSTVTFTLTVTNTNGVTLTNVAVTDAQAPDCAKAISDLAAGASHSYTCTVDNVLVDFTNSATATGRTFFGDTAINDTDTASVDVIHPGITIAKSPDSQTVTSGATVTFTITVTNSGDVTLTNVAVTDAQAPDCARPTIGDLAAGASHPYTCTVDNVIADFTNSATASGTPPVGNDVTDTDTATVTLERQSIYLPIILKSYVPSN